MLHTGEIQMTAHDTRQQRMRRMSLQTPKAEMRRSSSLIVPLIQDIVADFSLKSASSRAMGGQV